jgi:dolichol-phosphate mannosyltransferase
MKLSVIIPAHNEEGCIENTVTALTTKLRFENIENEILIVNDNSSDRTEELLQQLIEKFESVRYLNNPPPHGFGFAVRCGLNQFTGDAVALYMADASDIPEDLVAFFREMEKTGVDCVFGSRFLKKSKVVDYPVFKFFLNRFANFFIQILFGLRYNDTTNAFKLYRRHVIEGVKPIISFHFNLTVELPLKAIVRGFSYRVLPNSWINRKAGVSKLKIQEMGSRYLFIVLYCLIEKWLSRGDYHRERMLKKQI